MMRTFEIRAVSTVAEATKAARVSGPAVAANRALPVAYLAGGTTLVDLMKLDVLRPGKLVDINPLAAEHSAIRAGRGSLFLGALARMADVADHLAVKRDFPVIAQSLALAASAQLRNMASVGGNVLQRTRCPYFRDVSWTACNKRDPGSGCAAIGGLTRPHAVLGTSPDCIASYPGDFGVALIALDATVDLASAVGRRTIPFAELHRLPGNTPHVETTLRSGELITGFSVPAAPWLRRSLYLKIRDRESYHFAVASVAVALDLEGDVVRNSRMALGGLATRPWRAFPVEQHLRGRALTESVAEEAAKAAFTGAQTDEERRFKVDIGQRAIVRALLQCRSLEI